MKETNGFILVDSLIATFILLMLITVCTHLFLQGSKNNVLAEETFVANMVMQTYLEECRNNKELIYNQQWEVFENNKKYLVESNFININVDDISMLKGEVVVFLPSGGKTLITTLF